MANTKISALTAITGANVADDDVLVLVDTSVTTTKKITAAEAAIAMANRTLVLTAEQASTSGSVINFTSIPSWVKKITINFKGVSTNGAGAFLVRIGDAGGTESTGYLSGASYDGGIAESTSGFLITVGGVAAATYHGSVTLTLENAANFTWCSSGNIYATGTAIYSSAGSKSLSAALDRVSVEIADTFDAGAISVMYE